MRAPSSSPFCWVSMVWLCLSCSVSCGGEGDAPLSATGGQLLSGGLESNTGGTEPSSGGRLRTGGDETGPRSGGHLGSGGLSVVPLVDAGVDGGSHTVDSGMEAVDAAMVDAGPLLTPEELPYGRGIETFTPGSFAGFGQGDLPDIVLGPPMGRGPLAGSLDVLSLGVGGEIVIAFDDDIIDGDGPDFIVFENAFWPSGDSTSVFAELGEVSVSDDGVNWVTFPCDPMGIGMGRYPGCAGWTPTENYDPLEVYPLDPTRTGGDAFDLSLVGVERARFVRVRDLSSSGEGTNAGFDLDAIGVIHHQGR